MSIPSDREVNGQLRLRLDLQCCLQELRRARKVVSVVDVYTVPFEVT
jgi:hypothetical protein